MGAAAEAELVVGTQTAVSQSVPGNLLISPFPNNLEAINRENQSFIFYNWREAYIDIYSQ